MDASTQQGMISRLLRFGISSSSRSSSDDLSGQGELETELALLREENAWLKVERHRPPDTGRVVESMRELAQTPPVQPEEKGAAPATDPARTLAECLAIRDGLVEACKEIQEAMQGIRHRLSGLSVDVPAAARVPAVSPAITAPSTRERGLEAAVEPRTTTDLSQNVA